ncbi:MAG: DUF6055 domain-containing protein [Prolixibacteraceae bacterium]|jgi:hypothetical protein|nr:DUF6055 domain-containing protein [Prolixibacteraceae bacterium]
MNKYLHRFSLIIFLTFVSIFTASANQTEDIITIDGKKYKLLSDNLIPNPDFEDGFTGWTDATSSAAALSSAKFNIAISGGINNSKYLIGLTNENSSSSGSIGTGWPITSGKSYIFAYQVKYLDATMAAGSELYLKTSLTNNKTSSEEPKILINSTHVDDGGQWTQNYVFFTNSNPAYSYLVARFRWLSNRFGFDDFMLYEAVEVVNTEVLSTLIDEAQLLYNAEASGAVGFQSAITTAEGYLSSTSVPEITQAIEDLQTAIYTFQYANASPDTPLDMTHFIVNAGFDNNTATGWEGAGTVNYHEVEFYEKTFNMNQVLSELPAGKYRLKAQGFERPKLNDSGSAYKAETETIYARFYAQTPGYSELSISFNSIYQHSYSGAGSLNGYVNNMASAEVLLSNLSAGNYEMVLSGILIDEGETLTIGAKTDFQQSGYWVLFDNFRLEYLGIADINDLAIALNKQVEEARGLLTRHINTASVQKLNTAIEQAQTATSATPLDESDVTAAKTVLDQALADAYASLTAYENLHKAIENANRILGFLDKANEISKLQNAIDAAELSYQDLSLTLVQINSATNTLKAETKSVGKQIYVPTWMMGNVNDPSNNWSLERSRQSKNWILFWEPGYGDDPGEIVDNCFEIAEKSFVVYADSLKFIQRGASKTDTYKMIIRLRYTSDWEASGSGVDNTIGLLTLTTPAVTSRDGQTVAHEVGHCFQYQVHCDNNDMNGWMYGFGSNASGGNGWWEQCAQWQAYKVLPTKKFSNEWFSGYLNDVHKHILHESPRYNNFFVQDYWTYLHGKDFIGRLWNESIKPEDPVETYKRITATSQGKFNDEMWKCAARFATWDIPALKTLGAGVIASRPQPKMNNQGDYVWRIDPTVCVENYGHNIIRLNAPTTAKRITVYFEGLAGIDGYRKNYLGKDGWRYGLVALLKDGSRVYSELNSASMSENQGNGRIDFECPANCSKLWLVVSGAPSAHWRHAWDDNDNNDEQWPYQVSFNNTNLFGYTNVVTSVDHALEADLNIFVIDHTLTISNIQSDANIRIHNIAGRCLVNDKATHEYYTNQLSPGIYIVNVITKQHVVSKKVMIH